MLSILWLCCFFCKYIKVLFNFLNSKIYVESNVIITYFDDIMEDMGEIQEDKIYSFTGILRDPTPIYRKFKPERKTPALISEEIENTKDRYLSEDSSNHHDFSNDSYNYCETDTSETKDNFENEEIQMSGSRRSRKVDMFPFRCDLCDAGFLIKESVTAHKRRKHGEKKYRCEICNSSFALQRELTAHYEAHRVDEYFKCENCPKKFDNIKSFLRHFKTHVDQKNFVCVDCGNAFRTKGELTSHAATHSIIRKFSCEICGQGFNAQKLVSDHMNTHTGARPYVCECGKNFKTHCALSNHKKIHMDKQERRYKCNYCDMRFIFNAVRRKHERTHTRQKGLTCKQCGLLFNGMSELLHHAKTHKLRKIDKSKLEKCVEKSSP